MQDLRLQFEAQFKTKLAQKTSAHHTDTQVILETFHYFDLDNSGGVSFGEWQQACERLNVRLPRRSAEQLFNYYDFDGSGELNYREFAALILGKTKEQVEAEDVYALSGSGRVIGMPTKLTSRGRPENATDHHRTTTYEPVEVADSPPTVRSVNTVKALDNFRRKLLDRGVCGLLQLTEVYRRIDTDHSNSLSSTEFAAACSELKMGLSQLETQALFKLFDADSSGMIDYQEFCRAVRGPMNSFKKQLVLAVWDHLDSQRRNRIDLETLITKFNAANHPDVKQGRATPREVTGEFSSSVRLHHSAYNPSSQFVSKEEFVDLYSHFAAVYPDDRLFDLTLASCWDLPQSRPHQDSWEGARSSRDFSRGTGLWADQMHGVRAEEPEVVSKPDLYDRQKASVTAKSAGTPSLFARGVYSRRS